MAITSPSLVLSMESLFGNIRPKLDAAKRLGVTDFSAAAPKYEVKPGATTKIPVSDITAASAYNASSNNYLTGGSTTWAQLTCTHYLQGFDVSGVDVDSGIDANRMRQLFAYRAGLGMAAAVQSVIKTALNGTTTSTGVTIPAIGTAVLADYMGLAGVKDWFDASQSALAVNGAEYANIRALAAAANVIGDDQFIAQALGFRDLVLVPGMTARLCIVPQGSFGLLTRVPEIVVNYRESGTQTDDETGLSVGIVLAEDQSTNRLVTSADLWIGATTISANAGATTAGIVNVGTTSSL